MNSFGFFIEKIVIYSKWRSCILLIIRFFLSLRLFCLAIIIVSNMPRDTIKTFEILMNEYVDLTSNICLQILFLIKYQPCFFQFFSLTISCLLQINYFYMCVWFCFQFLGQKIILTLSHYEIYRIQLCIPYPAPSAPFTNLQTVSHFWPIFFCHFPDLFKRSFFIA